MISVPYTHHFGLRASAFSASPDADFLYMSEQHKEALAHLLYGLQTNGGIVLLTGEAGTGKTSVCRSMLSQLSGDIDLACIDEAELTGHGLVATACRKFGVECESTSSLKRDVDRLNEFLMDNHARGRRSVLLVDGAQRLSVQVLEQLRLLTNLETDKEKLLQVLLIGTSALREKLERQELRQLSQRIIARYHLRALNRGDVVHYVRHRLQAAGGPPDIVPASLARQLHSLSKGVPRTLNLLCDRALLDASTRGDDRVTSAGLQRAAQALGIGNGAHAQDRVRAWWLVTSTSCVALLAAVAIVMRQGEPVQARPTGGPARHEPDAHLPVALPVALSAPGTPFMGESPAPAAFTWPEPAARDRSASYARSTLLKRWRVAAGPDRPLCAGRLPDGLRCLQGSDDIELIRATNLPAILHLADDRGYPVDAVVEAVDSNMVSLDVAGTLRRVPWSALKPLVRSGYTLLWRAPPGFADVLRSGSRGATVAWLRTKLAQWRRNPPPAHASPTFDDALTRQVRQFQLAEGLAPDGVAGVRTLARLTARTDPSVPTLQSIPALPPVAPARLTARSGG